MALLPINLAWMRPKAFLSPLTPGRMGLGQAVSVRRVLHFGWHMPSTPCCMHLCKCLTALPMWKAEQLVAFSFTESELRPWASYSHVGRCGRMASSQGIPVLLLSAIMLRERS